MMDLSKLVVCESVAAITTHLRDFSDIARNYGGHWPKPLALCGAVISWDTKLPLTSARCLRCRELATGIKFIDD